MAEYEIIDNFLPKDEFNNLNDAMNKDMPWFYLDSVATPEDNGKTNNSYYYFFHLLYSESMPCSPSFDIVVPLLNALKMKALMRVKANLYPSTKKIIQHDSHVDFPYKHKGALFSINTCDGCTVLDDGTRIDSVANRLLLFDSSKEHSSTTCTNDKVRMNININYF